MSLFYGTVVGQAETAATRRGSRNSGIKVAAQSWDGSVITKLWYVDDDLWMDLMLSDGSDTYGRSVYYGKFEDFAEFMKKKA